MDNQSFHQFKEHKKGLFSLLIIILSIFLITLTVSTIVGIQNKIKQGRYIGREIGVRDAVTIEATGEVYAKPDLAVIDFSVITEATTVEVAMDQNTEKMNNVISFVKGQGIESKDLKTTSFYIYPLYEYKRIETQIYPYPPGKRVLVGYEVSQRLEVKIRDLSRVGQIIEGAASAGANQIGDLYFTIDNKDELKKQAREQAIAKAKTKAEELASLLDVKLVRIIDFKESSYLPWYEYDRGFAVAEGMGESPEIETGENKITISVTITYEIN